MRGPSCSAHWLLTAGRNALKQDERERGWTVKKISLAVLAGALLGSVFAAAPAYADDDRTCRGVIRAVSVDGDVKVPRGQKCTLIGTRVDGNVKVGKGATLIATKVRVDGDIEAEKARRVSLTKGSRVDGNIQIEESRDITIRSTRVDGDIQIEKNRGRVKIDNNKVDGNLQCEKNRPAPTGKGNRVKGDKEGQCRGF